jgi:hypothetical protein
MSREGGVEAQEHVGEGHVSVTDIGAEWRREEVPKVPEERHL